MEMEPLNVLDLLQFLCLIENLGNLLKQQLKILKLVYSECLHFLCFVFLRAKKICNFEPGDSAFIAKVIENL